MTKSATRQTARAASNTTTTVRKASSGEIAQARAILAGYIAKYPICKGATVYITMVPALQGGAQGCVFLGSGTIVINPSHSASLSSIIGHEIDHLVDYRKRHPGRTDLTQERRRGPQRCGPLPTPS